MSNSATAARGARGPTGANAGQALVNRYADGASTSIDGTEDDLYTDTLTAGILAINGQKIIETEAIVTVAHATATRRMKKYFGGTLIWDSGALTLAAATTLALTTTVIRESSTVVRCIVSVTTTSASTVPYATYTRVTGLTLANTQILKTTGIAAGVGAAASDIVCKLAMIEWRAAS